MSYVKIEDNEAGRVPLGTYTARARKEGRAYGNL